MKKLLCLLLAMLMILPLAVACTNNEQPPVSSGDDTTDGADSGDTTSAEPARAHKIPEGTSFANEEYYTAALDWQGYKYYFFADEESSDPMESAIYNRRREIEEEIDVKMTHFLYDDVHNMLAALEQEFTAGQSNVDTVLLSCCHGTASFSSQGYLYPLEKLEYVDLEADWWNLEQMNNLRASRYYYFGVNDFMIPCPYVIFFNKEMVEDMSGMQDPYQLVLDQKWTLDAFEEMARAATIDLNTDGQFTLDHDSFGVAVGGADNYCSFLLGFDQHATGKDEDGRMILDMNTEKMADIMSRFAELSKENVFYPDVQVAKEDQIKMDSGRLLFLLQPITYAEELRDCEIDFGMLPYPKYDEAQEDYRSLDWGGLMCVPGCVENPDLTGAVLELLAFKSSEEVIPAYYDIVLEGQLAQDPNSVKMLDILFDTICYDPGMNFWALTSPFMQLFFTLSHYAIRNQDGNWASHYARYGEPTQRQIDTYYQTLELYEQFNEAID